MDSPVVGDVDANNEIREAKQKLVENNNDLSAYSTVMEILLLQGNTHEAELVLLMAQGKRFAEQNARLQLRAAIFDDAR